MRSMIPFSYFTGIHFEKVLLFDITTFESRTPSSGTLNTLQPEDPSTPLDRISITLKSHFVLFKHAKGPSLEWFKLFLASPSPTRYLKKSISVPTKLGQEFGSIMAKFDSVLPQLDLQEHKIKTTNIFKVENRSVMHPPMSML